MVKQQVNSEFLTSNRQGVLTAYKGEPHAELQQEIAQMFQQAPLEFAFLDGGGQAEEIKIVGVLNDLLGELRLLSRKSSVEVAWGSSLAFVEVTFDLMHKDGSAPSVLNGLANVPPTLARILDVFKNADVMTPRDLCNNLLHKLLVGIGFGEGAHVFEVTGRESGDFRELVPEIGCKALDDLCSPAVQSLTSQNFTSNAPVEKSELSVYGKGGV